MKKILFFFILQAEIFAASVYLMNDSAYKLTAIIKGSNDIFFAQTALDPGTRQRIDFDDSVGYNVSSTPYKVVWICPLGEEYASCFNVNPGALCKASECSGQKYCKEKKKQETKKSTNSSSQQNN